jgi:hypothetical protein
MDRQAMATLATHIAAIYIAGVCVGLFADALHQRAVSGHSRSEFYGVVLAPIAVLLWLLAEPVAKRIFKDHPENVAPTTGDLHRVAAVFAGVLLTAAAIPQVAWWVSLLMLSAQTRNTLLGPVRLDAHDRALLQTVYVRAAVVRVSVQFAVGMALLLAPERFETGLRRIRSRCRREWARFRLRGPRST